MTAQGGRDPSQKHVRFFLVCPMDKHLSVRMRSWSDGNVVQNRDCYVLDKPKEARRRKGVFCRRPREGKDNCPRNPVLHPIWRMLSRFSILQSTGIKFASQPEEIMSDLCERWGHRDSPSIVITSAQFIFLPRGYLAECSEGPLIGMASLWYKWRQDEKALERSVGEWV